MFLFRALSHGKNSLEKALIIANHDLPEAGLDALMQAIVCNERIGKTYIRFYSFSEEHDIV